MEINKRLLNRTNGVYYFDIEVGEFEASGKLKDLSLGGAQLDSPIPGNPVSRNGTIRIHTERGTIQTDCHVLYSDIDRVGIRFLNTTPSNYSKLYHAVMDAICPV